MKQYVIRLFLSYLYLRHMAKKKAMNRIKEVLAEQGKTQTWLAEQLDMEFRSVTRWCNNDGQPPLETLFAVARILKVDPKELIKS